MLAVVGMLAVWANRLLFNPDNWSNTSTQLLQNPDIRDATANYVVDQLYANVNVAQLIQSGLPPRLQPLAGPGRRRASQRRRQGRRPGARATSGPGVVGDGEPGGRPAVHQHRQRSGRAGGSSGRGGVARPRVDHRQRRVTARPAGGLGEKLPPNIGQLTILKSNQLKAVQDIGSAVKGLALWLTILVPTLYAARGGAGALPPPADADDGGLRDSDRGSPRNRRPTHPRLGDHELPGQGRRASSRR